jgi:hypothetical protein
MSKSLRILDEDRLDIDGVCAVLECSRPTAYRALRAGLEHLYMGKQPGGKVVSSRQAIERYLAKLNGIDLADEASGATPSKRRQRELSEVDRKLAAAGI